MTRHLTLYDQDFYAWSQAQAALLREGAVEELDLENLAEEVDSLGKNLHRELGSRLYRLLVHLLKWRYQPARRSRSWADSIEDQRDEIARLCAQSPSLRPHLAPTFQEEYPRARRRATRETRLALRTFPETCPWAIEQVLDVDFWPEEEATP